jgi:chorismate mutase/prephenate dehydrogenase
MGAWLVRFFEDSGHHVGIVDVRRSTGGPGRIPDAETAVHTSRAVVLATPIMETPPLLERLLDERTKCLILDILSVKAPIQSLLLAGARDGALVTSVHPMFGPSARTLTGRNLLIASCGVSAADRQARALFRRSALAITTIPIEHHDRLIAESLGLSHLVNLLFLGALSAAGPNASALARSSSATFSRQAAVARDVAHEGSRLYLDIQALNPTSPRVYRRVHDALDQLERLVASQDLEGFQALVAAGAARLEPSSPVLGP